MSFPQTRQLFDEPEHYSAVLGKHARVISISWYKTECDLDSALMLARLGTSWHTHLAAVGCLYGILRGIV